MAIDMLVIGRLKYKLSKILNIETEFQKRIRLRDAAFWKGAGKVDVKFRKAFADDPIEKWEDVENWQRKLSNKHNSRQFAIKFGCKLPDLYWQGQDYSSIDFDALPVNYVIRPIAGSGGRSVFIMQNGKNLFDGKNYTPEDIVNIMTTASERNPKLEFLIEEFVTDEAGVQRVPDDYKLYMFNGNVACIQVINRLTPSKGKTAFYDENWKPLPRVQLNYATGSYQQAPKCIDEMIVAAKKLSKAYRIFARIDFYATHKGAVFGEITPTPFQGSGFTYYGNKLLIEKWNKYCKGLI